MKAEDDLLAAVDTIPRDEDGPAFSEPWEAQAFAMAVCLNARGLFTWNEWAKTLGAVINADDGRTPARDYYLLWLTALERIVCEESELAAQDLARRKHAWAEAAARTPHGKAVELPAR